MEFGLDFDHDVRAFVRLLAPRVFAVVSEHTEDDGERDACVVAWGMAHPDDGGVHVVSEDGTRLMKLKSPERAAWWFGQFTGGPVRLEWLDQAA